MFPNFFIAGVPKSGTTSLFHYLEEQPEVFMCPVKEPNYFSHEEIVRQGLYYSEKGIGSLAEYARLFKGITSEKAVGEASVSYLFYEKAPERIKAAVPDAKIIIILRDPVARGFSHYLMDSRLGYVDLSFEDIIHRKADHSLLDLYYQQFVELGFYAGQVRRYLDTFGEKQVRIFLTEDLKKDITGVILSICEFLGIDGSLMPDIEKQYNVYQKPRNALIKRLYSAKSLRSLARNLLPGGLGRIVKDTLLVKEEKPALSDGTKDFLCALYKNDVKKTADIIGRDLSGWCG